MLSNTFTLSAAPAKTKRSRELRPLNVTVLPITPGEPAENSPYSGLRTVASELEYADNLNRFQSGIPPGSKMEKWMCYGALGVAALMLLLSILDIAIGIPFGGSPFMMVDIFLILASGIVGYLGFNAMRDLR